jgi:hypothetical protein
MDPSIVLFCLTRTFQMNADSDDWWERARQNRERIERELDDCDFPDIPELIRQMRNERDVQILSTVFSETWAQDIILGLDSEGEGEAREMVLGRDADAGETE